MDTWDDMDFWQTGEWQACEEKINDLELAGVRLCPSDGDWFASFDAVPLSQVRVAILGQDPYPNPDFATGCAFDIPRSALHFPPTLVNIFKELEADMHYQVPTTGSLHKWMQQGVFLWNVIPVCVEGKSMSCDWIEWELLNKEIIERLSEKGVVHAFLGQVARAYTVYAKNCPVIETSHPSPRGSLNSSVPFNGSRLFSTINSKLKGPKIDWRL